MYRLKFYLSTHSLCLLGLMLLWQFVLNICADILRVCAWAHTKKYNDWVIWWLYVIYSERLLQFFHKTTALFHIVTNIFGHVSSSKFSPVLAMVNLFFYYNHSNGFEVVFTYDFDFCISSMPNYSEHILMCILAMFMTSFRKYLLQFFLHFFDNFSFHYKVVHAISMLGN